MSGLNKNEIRYAAIEAGFDTPISKETMAKYECFLSTFLNLNGILYTPEQFAKWEQEIRDNEREKVNKENRKALYKYCQSWK
tara:strand:+ start:480 stop:725 length:246 start_codon:yes stop_codon:yes gene_type:complete